MYKKSTSIVSASLAAVDIELEVKCSLKYIGIDLEI